MTTAVEPIVCFRDGQVTFFSSTLTSLKNWAVLLKMLSLGLVAAELAADDCLVCGNACFFLSLLIAASPAEAFFSVRSWVGWSPAAVCLSVFCFFFFFDPDGFLRCIRPIALLKCRKLQVC